MTEPETRLDEPIRSEGDLLGIFLEACRPRSEWRIGAEMEKFGVFASTGQPIQYDGGITAIFDALVARHGWSPEREKEGGPVISLVRRDAHVTLEPGSQLELSGAPAADVHAVCAEFTEHRKELAAISRELGVRWLGLGFHPFAKRSDLLFVPKARYTIMREYLPTRGAHALDMMLRTSTVQANYDYESEADAIRKMRVALRLAPLTTAMFANSPWVEGEPHGGVTYRGRVWLDVDPDRTGLLPRLLEDGAGFEHYVAWALEAPMFLFKRGGAVVRNTGQTFKSFWRNGFEGHHATFGDWQMHLNTLFPEVRLKRTIEVRGADAQGVATRCALPALWTGIFYDDRALADATALTADFGHDELHQLRQHVWREGLRASFRGKPLAELAEKVISIAEAGLERRGVKRKDGQDERIHLARLKTLVAGGRCPADDLLEAVTAAGGDFRQEVMRRADLAAS